MSVLVTGGGGFLGKYLVEQLLKQGEEVRVFSRGKYPELEKLGARTIQGDVRDSDSLSSACDGVETVFHAAAVPGIWGSWKTYHEINTIGTENVIAACQKHKIKKLIYTSSPSVVFDGQDHIDADETLPYPEEYLCHYPHSKALAEKAVLNANQSDGLLTCSLRPHLIWGPRDNHLIPRLLQRAASGKLRQVGEGKNLISMCYVENAAAAHRQAAVCLAPDSKVAGQAYFINDPVPVNLWEWTNSLLKKAGLTPIRKKISAKAAYRIGSVLEGIYSLLRIEREPPMTRFVALQLSQSHTYSIQKAKDDFGYQPIVDYETAIRNLEADLPRMLGHSFKETCQ